MSRASNYCGYRALGRGRKLTRSSSYSVGSVLCPPSQMVPVVSSFTAQVIVFEPKYPITAGYAVELFHHSRDIPATIASLDAMLDKASGQVTKAKPRSVWLVCRLPHHLVELMQLNLVSTGCSRKAAPRASRSSSETQPRVDAPVPSPSSRSRSTKTWAECCSGETGRRSQPVSCWKRCNKLRDIPLLCKRLGSDWNLLM